MTRNDAYNIFVIMKENIIFLLIVSIEQKKITRYMFKPKRTVRLKHKTITNIIKLLKQHLDINHGQKISHISSGREKMHTCNAMVAIDWNIIEKTSNTGCFVLCSE